MVKQIIYCDRCGKEVKYPLINLLKICNLKQEPIDLCQECSDNLNFWMKNTDKYCKEGDHD